MLAFITKAYSRIKTRKQEISNALKYYETNIAYYRLSHKNLKCNLCKTSITID